MTYQATQLFSDHNINVVVVEWVSSHICQMSDSFFYMTGHVKPVAIIVLGADDSYALDMDATVTDIQKIQRQIPDLPNLIKPFFGSAAVAQSLGMTMPSHHPDS